MVENGAGILEPGAGAGKDYSACDRLRRVLGDLPPRVHGFGDMTDDGLRAVTGLDAKAAGMERRRQFTEPGLWTGDPEGLETFLRAVSAAGIAARRVGRFLTQSFGATKADQMEALIHRFQPRLTVALGDVPNDVGMLERAALGVIVTNPSAPTLPPPAGEGAGRIRRSRASGPVGWAEAMREILTDHFLQGDPERHGGLSPDRKHHDAAQPADPVARGSDL
ncbi:MAG: hypothetical protein Kow0013_28930 [Pararhodobacter sp.]